MGDAWHILALKDDIKVLELRCKTLMQEPRDTQLINSIPGLAVISASKLAGRLAPLIGLLANASGTCLEMVNVDSRSGQIRGSKALKHVTKSA